MFKRNKLKDSGIKVLLIISILSIYGLILSVLKIFLNINSISTVLIVTIGVILSFLINVLYNYYIQYSKEAELNRKSKRAMDRITQLEKDINKR
jgi:hypothetical protein